MMDLVLGMYIDMPFPNLGVAIASVILKLNERVEKMENTRRNDENTLTLP